MTEFRAALQAEIANCLTHGIGAGLSIAGLAILVSFAAKEGDPWKLVSFTIYGSAMVILYLASTLYHAFLAPRAKKIFKILDHSAIFIAIAGTYTPFTLVSLRGPWGWTLFGAVWVLAILGITFKVFFVNRYRLLSVVVYILMGWMVVIAQQPVRDMIPAGGIVWMVAGGLAYTAGTAFYASRKPMSHMIWHLFVLAGSICHYMAVLFYVLPAPMPA
ncbi:MAG: hemolysin III family protein [Spirochaetia bacterium]|nr:hemolysin III family protein [Spirochaetia bacterium]